MDLTRAFEGMHPVHRQSFGDVAIDKTSEIMATMIISVSRATWMGMRWMVVNGFYLTRWTMVKWHRFMMQQVSLCGYEVLALTFIAVGMFMQIIKN